MKRSASAIWSGDLKGGHGALATHSGVLKDTPYSFATRFESTPGTNPEELIAAAHAGCFTMALAASLGRAGFTPKRLATQATVALEQVSGNWTITSVVLDNEAWIPGISADKVFVKRDGSIFLVYDRRMFLLHGMRMVAAAGHESTNTDPTLTDGTVTSAPHTVSRVGELVGVQDVCELPSGALAVLDSAFWLRQFNVSALSVGSRIQVRCCAASVSQSISSPPEFRLLVCPSSTTALPGNAPSKRSRAIGPV